MPSTTPLSQSAPDTRRSATMWVVNSDAEVRQLVENALAQYKHYLTICVSFTEDLEMSPADPPPQVILINATGPAQSSLAPLASLRQRWPDVKVIFLSPLDDIHLWVDAIRMGAHDFLPKPIDPDQLKWVLIGAFPTAQTPACKPSDNFVMEQSRGMDV